MQHVRIYRTWTWSVTPESWASDPEYKLYHHDQLQYSNGISGEWYDVPIVEAEKPESPQALKMKKHIEEISKWMEKQHDHAE